MIGYAGRKWLVFFTPESTAARLEHMGEEEEEAGIGTTTKPALLE